MARLLMRTEQDKYRPCDDFQPRNADSIDETIADLHCGLPSSPSIPFSSSEFPTSTPIGLNPPMHTSLDLNFGAVTHKAKSTKDHEPNSAARQNPAISIPNGSNAARLQRTAAGVAAAVSVTVVSLVLLGLVSGLVFYLERRRRLHNGSLYDKTAAKGEVMLSDKFSNDTLVMPEVEFREQRLTKEFDIEKASRLTEPGAEGSLKSSELTASEYHKTKKAVLVDAAASGDNSTSDRRSVYELQGDDAWERTEIVVQLFELQGREKLVPRAV